MAEVGIVGGEGIEAAALVEQLVEQIPAFATVVFDRAAVVVDLNGVSDVDGLAVGDGELRPGGMGDADEAAGGGGAAGDFRPGLGLAARRKVERQAGADDMPQLADRCIGGVQLGPQQRGEAVGAQVAGIGDGPVEALEEVFRQHEEIIAGVLVGLDHLVRRQGAVGKGRMGVEVAAPEAAG